MAEVTWDEIRRLHTDFLNLQSAKTNNRYFILRILALAHVSEAVLEKYILIRFFLLEHLFELCIVVFSFLLGLQNVIVSNWLVCWSKKVSLTLLVWK
jgi:hypothetical protein